MDGPAALWRAERLGEPERLPVEARGGLDILDVEVDLRAVGHTSDHSAAAAVPMRSRDGDPSADGVTAPEVVWVAPGVETGGLRGWRGICEAAGDDRGPMRVAAEDQRFTTGFVPPPHDHSWQRHPGVDLKGPAGPGQRGQYGAVLVLESGGIERSRLLRPMPHRVVDVCEHREGGRRFGQPQRLAQVGPDEIGGLGPVEEEV